MFFFSNLHQYCIAGQIPRENNHPARKPRVPSDHSSIRLLRRMPAQVRQRVRVETLHGSVRFPAADRAGGRADILPARGAQSVYRHARPHPRVGPLAGGAA